MTLPLADRIRRWSYLQDVELWLDPMPGRRRREVLRELRTNLADAAQDVGMARAIEDLGKPRALARSYLDTEPRRRPSWPLGVLGAGAVLAVALLALMAYAAGMADTLLATGGGTATGGFLGLRVVTEASENGLGWEVSGWSWALSIATVLGFLLASASWRLVTGGRSGG